MTEAKMTSLARRQFLQLAATAAALPTMSSLAWAESYPSRPVTCIVPTAAGGPQDVVARIVTERMRDSLGQPIVIENVAGATGTIGIGRVPAAEPDGYTLAFSVSFATHVVNPAVYSLKYDAVEDFEPIARVAHSPQLILAKKAMPADDLNQLIAWLKKNPGEVTVGHIGPGSPAHVAGIFFQRQTGARFRYVTYRGAGLAMKDLVGGHIDMMIAPPVISLGAMRGGKIKAYAVTAETRLPSAPDIPTVDEAGLPGLHTAPWFALWAPKGTPRDVITRLNAAVTEALADPAVRNRLGKLALEVPPREQQTPEALRAFHKAEIEKWWPIIKEAGIRIQ